MGDIFKNKILFFSLWKTCLSLEIKQRYCFCVPFVYYRTHESSSTPTRREATPFIILQDESRSLGNAKRRVEKRQGQRHLPLERGLEILVRVQGPENGHPLRVATARHRVGVAPGDVQYNKTGGQIVAKQWPNNGHIRGN